MKELKKATMPQNYVSTFSHKVQAEEEKLINSLVLMRNKRHVLHRVMAYQPVQLHTYVPFSISTSAAFKDVFSHLVEDAIGVGKNSLSIRNTPIDPVALSTLHPMHTYQLSLVSLTTSLLESQPPLHDKLKSIIDKDMALGGLWGNDRGQAIQMLRDFHHEASGKLGKALQVDGSHAKKSECWSQYVKTSRKGIRKAMQSIPIQPGEE